MTRLARVVVPGVAHHVTQRGNRREAVSFESVDYRFYLAQVAVAARQSGTAVLGYCLMPNHVHFIVTPRAEDGLRNTFNEPHRRYTSYINARRNQTGHLWQGRFHSTPMDERHLMAALRYIALNPVRAGLVGRAIDWPWSSALACTHGRNDPLVDVGDVLERTGDFADFLAEDGDTDAIVALRASYGLGRPIGAPDWIANLETSFGRSVTPAKRGRKPIPNPAHDAKFGDSVRISSW